MADFAPANLTNQGIAPWTLHSASWLIIKCPSIPKLLVYFRCRTDELVQVIALMLHHSLYDCEYFDLNVVRTATGNRRSSNMPPLALLPRNLTKRPGKQITPGLFIMQESA